MREGTQILNRMNQSMLKSEKSNDTYFVSKEHFNEYHKYLINIRSLWSKNNANTQIYLRQYL